MAHIRPMNHSISTLERAFELARSGQCSSTTDIRLHLKRERFDSVDAHLQGPSITRQLRKLCQESRRDEVPA